MQAWPVLIWTSPLLLVTDWDNGNNNLWPAWGNAIHWGRQETETYTYLMGAYCVPGTLPHMIFIKTLIEMLATLFHKWEADRVVKGHVTYSPNIRSESWVWPQHTCLPFPNRFPIACLSFCPAQRPAMKHPVHKGITKTTNKDWIGILSEHGGGEHKMREG